MSSTAEGRGAMAGSPSSTAPTLTDTAQWYADWQSQAHSVHFDSRAGLDSRNLVRNYECLNDIRILSERILPSQPLNLLEVGCATGEFCRYLRIRYPHIAYCGFDISQAAIDRARQKYPQGRFFVSNPDRPLAESLKQWGVHPLPELVYSKDVVHHQTQPFEFLAELLHCATDAVILRLRTRDVGPTELDPEKSCQYHYHGWTPYIVMNVDEVLSCIQREVPQGEIVLYRHYTVLGGRVNRFLPKDCYLPETKTAETAIGVFLNTPHPGKMTVANRQEPELRYTLDYRIRYFATTLLRKV